MDCCESASGDIRLTLDEGRNTEIGAWHLHVVEIDNCLETTIMRYNTNQENVDGDRMEVAACIRADCPFVDMGTSGDGGAVRSSSSRSVWRPDSEAQGQVTLFAVEDTYLDSASPETTHGSSDDLFVAFDDTSVRKGGDVDQVRPFGYPG